MRVKGMKPIFFFAKQLSDQAAQYAIREATWEKENKQLKEKEGKKIKDYGSKNHNHYIAIFHPKEIE